MLLLAFLQLVNIIIFPPGNWNLGMDGVRIWSSGCFFPVLVSYLIEFRAIWGVDLRCIPDGFGCRDSFFFYNLTYLMFDVSFILYIFFVVELQFWCLSYRFSISRHAQFRVVLTANCSPSEICPPAVQFLLWNRVSSEYDVVVWGNWSSWFTGFIMLFPRNALLVYDDRL